MNKLKVTISHLMKTGKHTLRQTLAKILNFNHKGKKNPLSIRKINKKNHQRRKKPG